MEELEQLPDEVYVQQIGIPSFENLASIMQINEERSWMTPYLEYLKIKKITRRQSRSSLNCN